MYYLKHCKLELSGKQYKVKKCLWMPKHLQAINSLRKLLSCKHRQRFMKRKKNSAWLGVEPKRPKCVNMLLLGSRDILKLGSVLCSNAIRWISQLLNNSREMLWETDLLDIFLEVFKTCVFFTLNTILICTNRNSGSQ